jgi:hypothetical protein
MNNQATIIAEVREHGHYECDWLPLINAYFPGDDSFDQIEAWATANGMKVLFSNRHQTCRFYTSPEAPGRATPAPPLQR